SLKKARRVEPGMARLTAEAGCRICQPQAGFHSAAGAYPQGGFVGTRFLCFGFFVAYKEMKPPGGGTSLDYKDNNSE
ncbi:MAG: hypothetical protein ACI9W6_002516, partial [Motiliproteus sp.]